jgi:ferredoxin
MTITVRVDGCEGHGNCYAMRPDIFAPDGDGYAEVVQAHPAESLLAAAQDAARNCPEGAIKVSIDS